MSGSLVERLADGSRVLLDSNVFIYFIEQNSKYIDLIRPVFRRIAHGEVVALVSTITLMEVLTRPLRLGQVEIAKQYRELLQRSANVELLVVDSAVAECAARFCSDVLSNGRKPKIPDIILLATATVHGVDAIVSNDRDFEATTFEVYRLDDFLS